MDIGKCKDARAGVDRYPEPLNRRDSVATTPGFPAWPHATDLCFVPIRPLCLYATAIKVGALLNCERLVLNITHNMRT